MLATDESIWPRMTISEPTTMITDYLLAGLALICGFRLWKSRATSGKGSSSQPGDFWIFGFFFAGAAAIVGGTFHGFARYQSLTFHRALWQTTVFLIAATATSMVAASLSGPLAGRH